VALNKAERFDPSGAFTTAGSLLQGRYGHAAVLLMDQAVLVVGGADWGGVNWVSSPGRSTAEVFDPTGAGSFMPTGSMSIDRLMPTASLLPNGKVLVAGGARSSVLYWSSAELYDPGTASFSPTGVMTTARAHHTAVLLPNGKVLVAGGLNGGGSVSAAELYDPAGETFEPTGPMTAGRAWATATLLANGKVLFAGGWGGTAALASAELYDPATGTFSATGDLGAARYYHTATRLPSGEVLVAGGYQGTYPQVGAGAAALDTAEIYDPLTGLWRAAGPLGTARRQHAAVLLPDGRTLVVGGFPTLQTAELYR
jgi:hypothetical protein